MFYHLSRLLAKLISWIALGTAFVVSWLVRLLLSCSLKYFDTDTTLLSFSLLAWLIISSLFYTFYIFFTGPSQKFLQAIIAPNFQFQTFVENINCVDFCQLHFQLISLLTPWKAYWVLLPDFNCSCNLVFITYLF